MTEDERRRLLSLRKRGKAGKAPLSEEEHAFCVKMWEVFPEEYGEVEREMLEWLRTASLLKILMGEK